VFLGRSASRLTGKVDPRVAPLGQTAGTNVVCSA